MSAYPTATEVLQAVSRFLQGDLLPVTKGREAFNLRVSINAVELVIRQMECGAAAEQAEHAGLEALLGQTDMTLAQLRGLLVTMIRRNDPAIDHAALLAHLRKTAITQLSIDQPGYSALVAALDAGERPWIADAPA